MYKIAIVGSSDADITAFSQYVLDTMTAYLPNVTYLVRGRKDNRPSTNIELFVTKVAEMWDKPVKVWIPDPRVEGKSQQQLNYWRDNSMVADADAVVAFYAPGRVGDGGTGHCVDSALRQEKEVIAFTLDENGRLIEVGHTGEF
jgi:hypothetical protein